MPSIEDGVHSVLLAKERVKAIDEWRHHETMGIQNFIWTMLAWAEKRRTERHQFWWAGSRRIVGWEACERRDHERRANTGGEIRSGGVDCGCGVEVLTVKPKESLAGSQCCD